MIKKFLRPINFIITMLKVKFLLRKYDNLCPYGGKLSENVFYQDVLPIEIIEDLKKIQNKACINYGVF